jgi:hypothetical protein
MLEQSLQQALLSGIPNQNYQMKFKRTTVISKKFKLAITSAAKHRDIYILADIAISKT